MNTQTAETTQDIAVIAEVIALATMYGPSSKN
jgi:hypothetical protein